MGSICHLVCEDPLLMLRTLIRVDDPLALVGLGGSNENN
jgi:hypothetical protein